MVSQCMVSRRLWPRKQSKMPANPQPVVFITAGASGIGAACVRRLLAAGFKVLAGVRDRRKGEELQQQVLGKDYPGKDSRPVQGDLLGEAFVPLLLDVTEAASVAEAAAMVQHMLDRDGSRLAGLINNATNERHGPIELLPLEFIREEMEVDYLGAVRTVKAMLPLLRRARGRIINFSSMNGRSVFQSIGANSAAKYAVEAVSDALRLELAPWGIEVVLIEPGATKTPIWDKALQKFIDLPNHVSAEQLRLYYPDWQAAVKHAAQDKERFLRGALPPERVADAVVQALTARRPKTRYVVGWDARRVLLLKWLLPDRWFDRVAMAAFNDQSSQHKQ
jgi:NAD(P)-dependent dehydrogenase (short-subunit alcohol dehydrogenase family)